jgi:hypothetical protein
MSEQRDTGMEDVRVTWAIEDGRRRRELSEQKGGDVQVVTYDPNLTPRESADEKGGASAQRNSVIGNEDWLRRTNNTPIYSCDPLAIGQASVPMTEQASAQDQYRQRLLVEQTLYNPPASDREAGYRMGIAAALEYYDVFAPDRAREQAALRQMIFSVETWLKMMGFEQTGKSGAEALFAAVKLGRDTLEIQDE